MRASYRLILIVRPPVAAFGGVCQECVYRDECTTATGGRTISISRYEARILKAKLDQQAPQWRAEYRAQRPKVERKIGHLTRKIHGGRKARTRGLKRVLTDFVTRAAAIKPCQTPHPRRYPQRHRLGHQMKARNDNQRHTCTDPSKLSGGDHPDLNNSSSMILTRPTDTRPTGTTIRRRQHQPYFSNHLAGASCSAG